MAKQSKQDSFFSLLSLSLSRFLFYYFFKANFLTILSLFPVSTYAYFNVNRRWQPSSSLLHEKKKHLVELITSSYEKIKQILFFFFFLSVLYRLVINTLISCTKLFHWKITHQIDPNRLRWLFIRRENKGKEEEKLRPMKREENDFARLFPSLLDLFRLTWGFSQPSNQVQLYGEQALIAKRKKLIVSESSLQWFLLK